VTTTSSASLPTRRWCGRWWRPPEEDDTLGYLVEYLQALRGFVTSANEAGLGPVIAVM
jgi:hypothetical protein